MLAAESPFEGERVNALSAATRLAAKHGMTLQEAARRGVAPPPPSPPRPPTVACRPAEHDLARFIHLTEQYIKADKKRRERALAEARARGLDSEETETPERPYRRPFYSRTKRNGASHARILLAETCLPLREVAALSGLDIYQVVGMKLKMRASL